MIVCYSANDKYYDLLEVSLKSLLESNKVSKVYILYSNFSNKFINSLKRITKGKCEIELIRISKEKFKDIEVKYLSVETYYRLLLPDLIKEDRAWYLDVDTLILDSIEKAYHQDLKHMIAAVPKYFQDSIKDKKRILGMRTKMNYFNAGVLLLDLKSIRELNFFQKVLDWRKKHHGITHSGDQDALNVCLSGQYQELDITYNVTEEISKIIDNPKIVHFTGEFKPNLFLYRHPFKKDFIKYFTYNKESFNIIVNLKYIKSRVKSLLVRIGSKIPFLKKIYRKFKPKKV